MLTSLMLRDYRSFGGASRIPLRRLTVLLGKNNSGKTSVARLPLFLAALASSESDDGRPNVPLRVRGLGYGGNLQDLVHNRLTHGDFEVGASYEPPVGGVNEFRVSLQLLESIEGESIVVGQVSLMPVLPVGVTWNRRSGSTDSPDYGDRHVTGFDGVFPSFSDERREAVEKVRRHFRKHMSRIYHLGSMRETILPVYETRATNWDLGTAGSEAPFLLRNDPEVLGGVGRWYKAQLGIDVGIEEFGFGFRVTTGSEEQMNLAFAGQGVQQVFSVVCLMNAVALGRLNADLVVVEEPELHLHPSAHPGIADLAISASHHSQVIIETHSENFCLRLRRNVAEGTIDPSDVLFVWCGDSDNTTPIEVAPDGSVSSWPRGVFSEDLEEVRAISRLRRP